MKNLIPVIILVMLSSFFSMLTWNQSFAAEDAIKTKENKQILEVARKFVDANSAAGLKYRLEIGKKVAKWALVDVIPVPGPDPQKVTDPAKVVLEKVNDKWTARDLGTSLEEWEEKVPELFK